MKECSIFKIIIIFFIFFNTSFGMPSMRKCVILPIVDFVNGNIGLEVFNKIENYLKLSRWCEYHSNSAIMDILSGNRQTLSVALNNAEVLKIISRKTDSGSLIRVGLSGMLKGVRISLAVLSGNGEDILLNKSTELKTDDIDIIAGTINAWLNDYEKEIPYVARVIGVVGQEVTIDIGKGKGIHENDFINIVRPIKKRRHPILKEIVSWKTLPVAKGKIISVGESQIQVRVIQYQNETLVQTEDWITLDKNTAKKQIQKIRESDDLIPKRKLEYSFGKLGELGLFVNIGSGSSSISSNSIKSLIGFTIGAGLEGEVWATRKYWVGIDFEKMFSSYSRGEGNLQSKYNNLDFTEFKLKFGYKSLPLGFFYGPQIDTYFGYGYYRYGLENQSNDEIVPSSFGGLLIGIRGNLPIVKRVRIYTSFEFLLFSSFSEDFKLLGDDSSSPSFSLELGGSYQFDKKFRFLFSFNYLTNKAFFASQSKTLNFNNIFLKFGTKFNF